MDLNDAPGRPQNQPRSRPTLPELAATRQALLDLAYDASSYLRRSARPAVRLAAALLVAASLAACGPSSVVPTSGVGVVQPLSQEVRAGLPLSPGRYPLVPGSIARDARGVYYFAWRRPGDPLSVRNNASASLLRLAQAPTPEIEVPAQGDPILYLPADATIPLVDDASVLQNPQWSSGGYYSSWHPFYGGSYRGPAYYDPPSGAQSGGGTVNGARTSSSPSTFSARTVGASHTVAARAGGTGSGTAATNKSGASASTSVDHGGAAAAKSAGFSAGHASAGGGSSSS